LQKRERGERENNLSRGGGGRGGRETWHFFFIHSLVRWFCAKSRQGVLKEVRLAITTVLTTTLELVAAGAGGAEQPPPRVHSPSTPPLPSLSSGYIISNLCLLSRPTVQVRHFKSKFLFFFFSNVIKNYKN